MQSTLALFVYLVNDAPPLLSEDLKYQLRKELKNKQENESTLAELEKTMIQYGYELWPWNQAFKEFLRQSEDRLGEQFFLSHLNPDLQKKYFEYRELGVTWREIYSGRAVHYIDESDRLEITQALISMRQNLKDFTSREVVGIKKQQYLDKVAEFKIVLEKIKENLNNLRALAQGESNHPTLANEISARVEAFEHGLCHLAPSFEHSEVEEAREFFVGRQRELNRLRGIQNTVEVDFYSED